MAGQPRHRPRLETSTLVAELQLHALACRDHHRQRIVGLLAHAKFAEDFAAVAGGHLDGIVLKHQQCLEQSLAARQLAPALDLDQRAVAVLLHFGL